MIGILKQQLAEEYKRKKKRKSCRVNKDGTMSGDCYSHFLGFWGGGLGKGHGKGEAHHGGHAEGGEAHTVGQSGHGGGAKK